MLECLPRQPLLSSGRIGAALVLNIEWASES